MLPDPLFSALAVLIVDYSYSSGIFAMGRNDPGLRGAPAPVPMAMISRDEWTRILMAPRSSAGAGENKSTDGSPGLPAIWADFVAAGENVPRPRTLSQWLLLPSSLAFEFNANATKIQAAVRRRLALSILPEAKVQAAGRWLEARKSEIERRKGIKTAQLRTSVRALFKTLPSNVRGRMSSLSTCGGCSGKPFWLASPEKLVGRQVSVLWAKSKRYEGKCKSYDATSRQHTIAYNDGETKTYNMTKKIFWIVGDPANTKYEKGVAIAPPLPAEPVGCGDDCTKRHVSSNCLRCGKGWGSHGGHNCMDGSGARGSWPLDDGDGDGGASKTSKPRVKPGVPDPDEEKIVALFVELQQTIGLEVVKKVRRTERPKAGRRGRDHPRRRPPSCIIPPPTLTTPSTNHSTAPVGLQVR